MNRLLSAAVALLCAIGFALPAAAQTTTITASALKSAGAVIPAGKVVFTAVNSLGAPIGFADSSGAFNTAPSLFSCTITAGALSSCTVPDSALTTPQNILYKIQILNTTTGTSYTIPNPVAGVTGSTWALDHYGPPSNTTAIQTITIQTRTTAPPSGSGVCVNNSFYVYTGPNALYSCIGTAWVLVSGGNTLTVGKSSGQAASGPLALTNMGAYSSGTSYALNDIVTSGTGSSAVYYVSQAAGNVGNPLTDAAHWLALGSSSTGLYPSVATSSILPAGSNVYVKYHAYGDSYTHGEAASDAAHNFVSLLSNYVGLDPTNSSVVYNHGNTGWFSCNIGNGEVFSTTGAVATDNTILQTLFEGINDGNNLTSLAGGELNYVGCHSANIAWLGTGAGARTTGASFGSVPTNWSADTRYAAVTGLQTTTNGAVSTWPITFTASGQTGFLFYRVINGNGGEFSYSGCNVPSGIVSAAPPVPITGVSGSNISDAVFVVPLVSVNVAAGTCSLTITATSPTGSGNVVSILATAVAPASITSTTPKLWVAGVPEMPSTTQGIAFGGMGLMNHLSGQIVRQMRIYGLDVNFVDIRKRFNNSPAVAVGDGYHPNDAGYAAIAQAWEDPTSLVPFEADFKIPATAAPAQVTNVSTATFTPSCLQNTLNATTTTAIWLRQSCPSGTRLRVVESSAGSVASVTGPGTAGIFGYAGYFKIPNGSFADYVFTAGNGNYWTVLADNARLSNPSAVTLTGGNTGLASDPTCPATCSAQRGRISVPMGSSPSAGWLASTTNGVAFTVTPICTVTQVGGAGFYGLYTSNVTSGGVQFNTTNAPSASATVTFDYECRVATP